MVLIDGSSIAYRAFYGLPLLNNQKGIHTNAILGFAMMLLKVIESEHPTHIAVCFDAGKLTFRHEKFPNYKGGRQKTPPELSEQFPFIRELIAAMGIHYVELDQYEADDLIGTYAKIAEREGAQVKIISGDRDLLQLVSARTSVALTKKGVTEMTEYHLETLMEQYGLKPEQIIDMKGLMGDSSDNIPGVPGVGEKTALKLLHAYHSIEGVYQNLEDIRGAKLKEKLKENKDLAFLSRELAMIHCEAPLPLTLEETRFLGIDQEKTIGIFKEFEFKKLLQKMNHSFSTEASEESDGSDLMVEVITNFDRMHIRTQMAFSFEFSEENYHHANLLGVGIYNGEQSFFINGDCFFADQELCHLLADETIEKFVFDAKRVWTFFAWKDITVNNISFDLMLAAYILNPSENFLQVSHIAKMYGVTNLVPEEEIYGKGASKKEPTLEAKSKHAAAKAKYIFESKPQLYRELVEKEQFHLYCHLEMPLAKILSEMEFIGVKIDSDTLLDMQKDLKAKIEDMEARIYMLTGATFNINSPKQLGVILFEKLGLPPIKKTKTGYSTSADVLEKLRPHHEVIDEILTYRQLGKLYSTYVEGLLKVVDPRTGKIHTRFNQAVTQTGRLSSTEPNLQNIPIRLEEGRKIRKAFVPSKEGWQIFAADYSQIELRVLAHMSHDANLIQAFQEDRDIHTKTAMDVFHVNENEVTSNMRRQAKAVNFGIVYGISDYGLSQNLNITRKEAAGFIQQYFSIFTGVQDYMKNIVKEAKYTGYVTTLLNRRRYIPDINSSNFNIRSFAERTAINTPVQGSAADIIKKAMIDTTQEVKKQNLNAKLLLQVHDELVFEVASEDVKELQKIVTEKMEQAVSLSVPLKVDCSFGPTWFDAK